MRKLTTHIVLTIHICELFFCNPVSLWTIQCRCLQNIFPWSNYEWIGTAICSGDRNGIHFRHMSKVLASNKYKMLKRKKAADKFWQILHSTILTYLVNSSCKKQIMKDRFSYKGDITREEGEIWGNSQILMNSNHIAFKLTPIWAMCNW